MSDVLNQSPGLRDDSCNPLYRSLLFVGPGTQHSDGHARRACPRFPEPCRLRHHYRIANTHPRSPTYQLFRQYRLLQVAKRSNANGRCSTSLRHWRQVSRKSSARRWKSWLSGRPAQIFPAPKPSPCIPAFCIQQLRRCRRHCRHQHPQQCDNFPAAPFPKSLFHH